jgi:putative ABC transport system permease protein
VTRVGDGERISVTAPLYVATPAVLAHFGIDPAHIDPSADVLSSRTDLGGLVLFHGARDTVHPKIQRVDVPVYSSEPNSLITTHAMAALGLQAVPSAWLVQAAKPLTAEQINAARKVAATAGLDIETQSVRQSDEQLRIDATAFGLLVALGVLAMTVGLIRSETASDLRTLTATGATSRTRRTLTATTAGAMALLGAVMGCAGAYAALIVWNRSALHSLTQVPFGSLAVIVVGLPLAAIAGGWLLAGREPRSLGIRPAD